MEETVSFWDGTSRRHAFMRAGGKPAYADGKPAYADGKPAYADGRTMNGETAARTVSGARVPSMPDVFTVPRMLVD